MIRTDKNAPDGLHGEDEKYEAWSISGSIGYVDWINCRSGVPGKTIFPNVAHAQDGWTVTDH